MADILQSAAVLAVPIAPDAGLQTGTVTVSGWPAIALAIGPPGTITAEGTLSSSILQTAPIITVVIGPPGTLTTAGGPVILNRLGGRLLTTGILGGTVRAGLGGVLV